jgi:hypothetical protein
VAAAGKSKLVEVAPEASTEAHLQAGTSISWQLGPV